MRKLAALIGASVLAFTVAACDPSTIPPPPSAWQRGEQWYVENTGPAVPPTRQCSNADLRSGTAEAPFVISGCIFSDGIYAGGKDHVHIVDSLIVGKAIIGYGDATGWAFIRTEHDGSTVPNDDALVGDAGYTMVRADVHGGSRGATVREDVVILESYMHDLSIRNPAAHRSAIGSNGSGDGSGVLIQRNWLEPGDRAGLSGTLVLYGDFQQVRNVTIEANYFNGSGSYTTYGGSCSAKPYPLAEGVSYTNNTFGPDMAYGHRECWSSNGGSNVWTGNVDTAGNPVP